jgi:hypothetical protein
MLDATFEEPGRPYVRGGSLSLRFHVYSGRTTKIYQLGLVTNRMPSWHDFASIRQWSPRAIRKLAGLRQICCERLLEINALGFPYRDHADYCLKLGDADHDRFQVGYLEQLGMVGIRVGHRRAPTGLSSSCGIYFSNSDQCSLAPGR